MATQAVHSTIPVLNSWKEIALYLGRGVRTVQRYEQEQGLPVRRMQGKSRSSVMALKSDLDLWLSSTPVGLPSVELCSDAPIIPQLRKSMLEHADLRDKVHALRLAHEHSVLQLKTSLEGMTEQIVHLREKILFTKAIWPGQQFDPCSVTTKSEEQSLRSGVFLRKNS